MSAWLKNLLVVGGPAIVLALALGRWLTPKLIDQLLQVPLEKFKSEQQKELERLRHLLSSRVSRIHEKEFEVLPKAWLMLNDLHGSVALALDMTVKSYPDFRTLPEPLFEEFLNASPATRLTDYQKQELRGLQKTDRQSYFTEAMAGNFLDDATEKQRNLQNYLIEHRIFMTDDLRDKFSAACLSLVKALESYRAGKAANAELVQSAYEQMAQIGDIVAEVEKAVQKRLRYEEA